MPNESILSVPTADLARPYSRLACTWEQRGVGVAWVHLAGELDIATAPQLSPTIAKALRHAGLVVIDLRELSFMDSAGARAFRDACARARRDWQRVVAVRGNAQVERMFALMDISDHVHLVEFDARHEASSGQVSSTM